MCVTYWSVPWIRQLIAGLSSRRPGFDPSIVHVAFIVEVAALGHFYLTTSGFPTVTFHQCSIFVHWHYISLANDVIIKWQTYKGLHIAYRHAPNILQASPDSCCTPIIITLTLWAHTFCNFLTQSISLSTIKPSIYSCCTDCLHCVALMVMPILIHITLKLQKTAFPFLNTQKKSIKLSVNACHNTVQTAALSYHNT